MSETNQFSSMVVKSAADVESWHPELEILVRYELPFVCFDAEGSAVHISPAATRLLARHRHLDAVFEALRGAAQELLELAACGTSRVTPRPGRKVNDPGDGGLWSVHVVRTRHDWQLAVAVNDGARTAMGDAVLRERLTRRELEVAALVADGAPAKNVASALSISIHTARRHTENVFQKLGVHSRSELTNLVLRSGEPRYASSASSRLLTGAGGF